MMWVQLAILLCVGVFIFLYNSLAMQRKKLREIRFRMEALLKQRRELAGISSWSGSPAEALAFDTTLTEPENEAELFRKDGELIAGLRKEYNEWAERCNPAFRSGFGRFFRFQEWPRL